MNLKQVKPLKILRWPSTLTPLPEGHVLTASGEAYHRMAERVTRGKPGFVVDVDSTGEAFFCAEDARNLEDVSDHKAALAMLEKQGPITFQPALDWLDENTISKAMVRPEPVETKNVPVSRMKKAQLEELADELEIPHGSVGEMRSGIETKLAEGAE